MKRKILVLGIALSMIIGTGAFAGLKVEWSKAGQFGSVPTQFNDYISKYTSGVDQVFGGLADAFTVSNIGHPVFGEAHRSFVIGVSTGISVALPPDAGSAGAETLNFGIGASAAPFVTFSLGFLSDFGLGFFEDTDLTFKIFKYTLNDISVFKKMEFFNLGMIFRKKLVGKTRLIPLLLSFEGISLSLGTHYTNNKLDIEVGVDQQESVDLGDGFKATLTADKAFFTLETESFSLDAEMKFYLNILAILDVYAGIGASYQFISKVTSDSSIPATLRITNTHTGGGLDDSDTASLLITGEGEGQKFLPRVMGGIQINLGPIKLPVQASYVFNEDVNVYTINFGLSISF